MLFVRPSDDRWFLSGGRRENEEVSNPEAPWVVAVRHYVRIAELNDYEEESQLLADLRNQGLSRTDLVNAPIALAQDIEDHELPSEGV